MKKNVFLSLFSLCLPLGLMAQSAVDDLYFVPSKEKKVEEVIQVKKEPQKKVTTNIYTSPGTTVVVQDRKGKVRDTDEYNRRYDARDNNFEMENDTLYIKEKKNRDLDGEWVGGKFEGTESDYELAERIIRFRNPRFAISISSPMYWDVVYGVNSWNWNVYTDGMYAYAFPTFSNPYWWDWRFNSWNWNWNWGWGRPYYGGGYYGSIGYWDGWHGGYWGHYHHNDWYGRPNRGWGGSGRWSRDTYTNRRSVGYYSGDRNVIRSSSSRYESTSNRYTRDSNRGTIYSPNSRRVVGTRSYERYGSDRYGSDRMDASSRRSTYTRPSSTRYNYDSGSRESYDRNSSRTVIRSGSDANVDRRYSRGSSSSSRSYNSDNGSRSYNSSSSRSSRGFDSSSSRSSQGSSYNSSGSSSSRTYSGGGGSSSRSSSGGGSSRSTRR